MTLSGIEGTSAVEDKSDLFGIKNKKGDEEFDSRDGVIYWENKGSTIEYEGESARSIPVNVDITYMLDGEEITPEDLAGKAGEVTIRFDYNNNTVSNVAVDGGAYEMPVPFVVITAVIFPEGVWDSIEVKNGKRTTLASQDVVMGIVFPGLKGALGLSGKDIAEDLEIPDFIEIKGKTKDFRMDMSTTIFQNGLFRDMDESDDVNDLIGSADDLADAGDEIVSAAGKLLEGQKKLNKGIKGYLDGAEAIDTGIDGLAEGIDTLNSQKKSLVEGISGLKKGADGIDKGLSSIISMIPEDTEDPQLAQIRAGLVELEKGASALADGSDKLAEGAGAFSDGIGELSKGAGKLKKGSNKLVKNNKDIKKGLGSMEDAVSEFKKGLAEFRDEGISEIVSFIKDDVVDLDNRLNALKKRDSEYRSFSGADKKTDTSVMIIIETAEIK